MVCLKIAKWWCFGMADCKSIKWSTMVETSKHTHNCICILYSPTRSIVVECRLVWCSHLRLHLVRPGGIKCGQLSLSLTPISSPYKARKLDLILRVYVFVVLERSEKCIRRSKVHNHHFFCIFTSSFAQMQLPLAPLYGKLNGGERSEVGVKCRTWPLRCRCSNWRTQLNMSKTLFGQTSKANFNYCIIYFICDAISLTLVLSTDSRRLIYWLVPVARAAYSVHAHMQMTLYIYKWKRNTRQHWLCRHAQPHVIYSNGIYCN